MTTTLRLPPLYCPFEPGVHAQVELAESWMLRFCRRHKIGAGRVTADDLREMRIAEFVARAYADVSVERLCIILDWTVWAFVADDRADFASPDQLRVRYAKSLATLRGTAPLSSRVPPLDELRHRILAASGERCLQRFAKAVETWFDAMLWEVTNRAERVAPTLAEYIEVREFDVGMYTEFALFDVTHATDRTDAIWDIAEVRTLMAATSNIIGWSNDIYSYLKESAMQDPHNLVGLLAAHQELSIPEALAEAAIMHNREVDRFIRIEARLAPRLAELPEARSFVQMLRAWIRSNLDWSLRSARYDTTGASVVMARPNTDAYRAIPPRAPRVAPRRVGRASPQEARG